MKRKFATRAGLLTATGAALAVLASTGAAHASTTTLKFNPVNTGGSGVINPTETEYPTGATAVWSETSVTNSQWNIVNATITVTDAWNAQQTYTITEKQKATGGTWSLTGTLSMVNAYASATSAITPLTGLSAPDVPFGDASPGVFVERSSSVGSDLFQAEVTMVYSGTTPLLNAAYWFGN